MPKSNETRPETVKHHTLYERKLDAVERAFWRLNDWTHGSPSFAFRNHAWTWQCQCGASAAIANGALGYHGRAMVTASSSKDDPCPILGDAIARGLEQFLDEPDDVFDSAADTALIRERADEVNQTLAEFCERVTNARRKARGA